MLNIHIYMINLKIQMIVDKVKKNSLENFTLEKTRSI